MKLELYKIRCAELSEYDKIRSFINMYWKNNHILVESKKLFDFQHLRVGAKQYDFVIAEHKETGEIHAVYGFINSAIYDMDSSIRPNAVWGALWKVRKDVNNKEIKKIGLAVLYYILDLYPNSPFITLGLSKYSQFIFEGLNFGFGKMNHYYFANKDCISPIISKNLRYNVSHGNSKVCLKEFLFDREIVSDYIPKKNNDYLLNRYSNHPYYKYDLWGMYIDDVLINVWVTRLIAIEGARCLRLVDIIGRTRNWPNAVIALQSLVEKYNAEYVDCYNYGIKEAEFMNLGMFKVEDPTIIPNYFEPFEQRNIDVYYAFCYDKEVCIFKGDGDQDRPTIINNQ